jgi:acetyl esterase/lipase
MSYYKTEIILLWPSDVEASGQPSSHEQGFILPPTNDYFIRNITQPTLTIFRPAPERSSRGAILVCPGGGFQINAYQHEGTAVAEWLAERGFVAGVLKYRIAPLPKSDEEFIAQFEHQRKLEPAEFHTLMSDLTHQIMPLAIADTQQALRIMRQRATEWDYAPERIGAIGFSAGGRIVIELTIASDPETRPAFVASIYGALFSDLIGDGSVHQLASVSSSVPPLFMVVAADDPIGLDEPAYRCYQAWRRAGSPAELHIYAQGGHGFGMNKKGLPSDTWIDRFGDWLQAIVL